MSALDILAHTICQNSKPKVEILTNQNKTSTIYTIPSIFYYKFGWPSLSLKALITYSNGVPSKLYDIWGKSGL